MSRSSARSALRLKRQAKAVNALSPEKYEKFIKNGSRLKEVTFAKGGHKN